MTDTGQTCLGPVIFNSRLKETYLKNIPQENHTLMSLINEITIFPQMLSCSIKIHLRRPGRRNRNNQIWEPYNEMTITGKDTLLLLTH